MKTPVAILGILGRFLAVLCLSGMAVAEANPPPVTTPHSIPNAAKPTVAPSQNLTTEGLPIATTPRLSPWTKEIVKLAQSGIEEPVMLAFIDNSGSFELGADQIVYLNDIGISASVVGAMLQHDRELATGERLLTIVSEPPYEPVFPAKPVSAGAIAVESVKPLVVSPPVVVEPPAPVSPPVTQTLQLAAQSSLEATSTFVPAPQTRASETKRPQYPVREPRTVELLPPIVFFNTAEVVPNTLIVYGFPGQ